MDILTGKIKLIGSHVNQKGKDKDFLILELNEKESLCVQFFGRMKKELKELFEGDRVQIAAQRKASISKAGLPFNNFVAKGIKKNRTEQFVCDLCGSDDIIEAPHMGKNCNLCNPL